MTAIAARERRTCIVPRCPRTCSMWRNGEVVLEWICDTHYRPVPRRLKLLLLRARRRRKTWLHFMVWQRIRKVAIEAAGGIG